MISRELDEAQGLTVEMFRQYLQRSGWTKTNAVAGVTGYAKNRVWVCDLSLADAHNEMSQVARVEGLSVQALLREINPRMRKGAPSKAARDSARPCYWLALWDSGGRSAANLWDSDLMDNFADSPDVVNWSFWPCDAHGNKVRWPNKDGVML